jgi:hypothetical protein
MNSAVMNKRRMVEVEFGVCRSDRSGAARAPVFVLARDLRGERADDRS